MTGCLALLSPECWWQSPWTHILSRGTNPPLWPFPRSPPRLQELQRNAQISLYSVSGATARYVKALYSWTKNNLQTTMKFHFWISFLYFKSLRRDLITLQPSLRDINHHVGLQYHYVAWPKLLLHQSQVSIKSAVFICPTSALESSHVVAAFQTSVEKESLYWMVYLEMGLWLSAPRLHCSVALLSVLFVTRTPPGAPGGPGVKRRIRDESGVEWCGCKVVMRLVI